MGTRRLYDVCECMFVNRSRSVRFILVNEKYCLLSYNWMQLIKQTSVFPLSVYDYPSNKGYIFTYVQISTKMC